MKTIQAKAPGSIMLMGEHAVLFGERAIACAVDKYITVTLAARDDRRVMVNSALGNYQSDLDHLEDSVELSFVVTAIRQLSAQLPSGFVLTIEAGFSHTVGLGSSAAVTGATVAVLRHFCELDVSPSAVFDDALTVVHSVQGGRGSGTDLVASIFGGLVAYTVSPRQITPVHKNLPPISLFYAGYKTKTPDVLAKVEAYTQNHPALFKGVYQLMGETSQSAEKAMLEGDWATFGQMMNVYQGLMESIGVCDGNLAEMLWIMRACEGVQGAKISGSGLGDCVVALGHVPEASMSYEAIPVNVSETGVVIHA